MAGKNISKTVNYMVPSTGQPNMYPLQFLNALGNALTPGNVQVIDFSNVKLNLDVNFQPSGLYVDNTRSSNPVVVRIKESGQQISVPAGASIQTSYPAPVNHKAEIEGDGEAVIIFVDFPVFPASSNPTSSIAVFDKAIGFTSDSPTTDPLNADETLVSLAKGAHNQRETLQAFLASNFGLASDGINISTVMGYLNAIQNTIGRQDDNRISSSIMNAPLMSFIKGIAHIVGEDSDGAPWDGLSNASVLNTNQRIALSSNTLVGEISDLNTKIGDLTDAAWNGTDPAPSIISILKSISQGQGA